MGITLMVRSVEPCIPEFLAARYLQAAAAQAPSAPPVPSPSTQPRAKACQATMMPPPDEPTSDNEIDNPAAWHAALDVGRPTECYE